MCTERSACLHNLETHRGRCLTEQQSVLMLAAYASRKRLLLYTDSAVKLCPLTQPCRNLGELIERQVMALRSAS